MNLPIQRLFSCLFLMFLFTTNLFPQQPTFQDESSAVFEPSTLSFWVNFLGAKDPFELSFSRKNLFAMPSRSRMPIDLSLIDESMHKSIIIIDYAHEKELFLEENIADNLQEIRKEVLNAQRRGCWVVLNLSDIDLYRIPGTFFVGLINIVWLDLSHNHLIDLPHTLHYLINLQVLDLSYNFFSQSIFCTLDQCKALHTVNLSHNQIEIIFCNTSFSPSLCRLDISHNQEDSPDKILYLPHSLMESPIEIHAEGNNIQFM